ncbi:hypothetical protein HK098_001371 [Nowakowskiella sp. JEL0407]|nr:hypothetical protein HK098_001371 [Nowakowskiella sp. JEL0407]
MIHVNAHGVVTEVIGANGVKGTGFGVDQSTPRDCTRRNPCQQDTSIIRAREVRSGRASACGRTLLNGAINIQAETQKQIAAGNGILPSIDANGQVQMVIHQINGDGGGPYACDVDPTGTGNSFQAMTVTQNVPGRNGNNRKTQLTDHPVTAQLPAGVKCSGGPNGNMCLVRCKNPALAGPFGSCMAFQQDGAAAGGGAVQTTTTDAAAQTTDAAQGTDTASADPTDAVEATDSAAAAEPTDVANASGKKSSGGRGGFLSKLFGNKGRRHEPTEDEIAEAEASEAEAEELQDE